MAGKLLDTKNKIKVFISTTTFAEFSKVPLVLLEKQGIGYELSDLGRKLTEDEISDFLSRGNFTGLLAGTEPLSAKVLENAPALKVISRVGAGMDNVDMEAAKKRNIKVMNTPLCLIDSVAELTLGLILSSLRRITLMNAQLHNGIWKKEMGFLLKGKTLGIVGFGKIGGQVAKIAKCFQAKVLLYDVRKIKSRGFKQVSLNKIMEDSDIITFHTSSKEKLIAAKEISMMKQGVLLVNTSRGTVIDEDSLYEGLKSGKIGFAALDVYENEPYTGRLKELDNVILTPHIGSYAKEARIEMENESVKNLIKALKK